NSVDGAQFMNESLNEDDRMPAREEPGGEEAQSGPPSWTEARLAQGLRRALADGRLDADAFGQIDLNELARRLLGRAEDEGPDEVQIARWMMRLDRRMRRVEARLAALAGQAAKQQEAIGMISTILRDLDDPYGFGSSLDERLAHEWADRAEHEK